jgi:DNA polymerase-3 subunit beta
LIVVIVVARADFRNFGKFGRIKESRKNQKGEKNMEFSIKQETLKEEIGFIQGIIDKKTISPALSSILFQSVSEDKIRVTGSNLEMTMHINMPAQVSEQGTVLVSAKRIFDIARSLDLPEIRFRAEESSWVHVESGNAKFRIASIDVTEYPEVPAETKVGAQLDSNMLLAFIQMTGFAISQEQSRYLLSAAKFLSVNENDGKSQNRRRKLRMVTTDGHRLAMVEKDLEGESSEVGNLDILIPRRALQEIAKICRHENKLGLGEDERHLYFTSENRSLIVRKLVGNFPNYEAVIPKESPFVAEFDSATLRAALRRVSLMADEMSHAVKITLMKNEAVIEAFSQDGEAKEVIPVVYDGEDFTIGFNSQYIQEFLDVVLSVGASKASESSAESVEETEKEIESNKVKVREVAKDGSDEEKGRIRFEFRDSNSQVLMRPLGWKDYNYVYVLMPLRL